MDPFKVVVHQTVKIVNMFGNGQQRFFKTHYIFLFRTTTNIRNSIHLLPNVQNYFLN